MTANPRHREFTLKNWDHFSKNAVKFHEISIKYDDNGGTPAVLALLLGKLVLLEVLVVVIHGYNCGILTSRVGL